jgi:hypothetical protein
MKHLHLLITLLCFSLFLKGQVTPMEFLNAIPIPPADPCGVTMEQKQQFLDELASFNDLFQQKRETDQETTGKFQEEHQEEMTVNALVKAGYSREDAEKMKNLDNMSEEEKMAMANQMMMKQYNMGMKEAEKVSEYDSVKLNRWAKAQSTMMMAEAQVDPESNAKKQLEIKNDLDLQKEFNFLDNKLKAGENKYYDMLTELELKADTALSKLNPQIDKLYKDLQEGNGDADQIIERIQSLRQNYCEKFTPSYLEIIEAYKGYVVEHWQQYYDQEELQLKITERQVGMRDPNYKPGQLAMMRVKGYLFMVSEVFKYNLNADIGAQFIGY